MRIFFTLGAGALFLTAGASAHDVLHASHEHAHGSDCGHAMIEHDGHVDHLHDGHMHHAHEGHFHEHALAVSSTNPQAESLVAKVDHDEHDHGDGAHMHATVQHGDHFDNIHDGRLHHHHGDHVDDHGPVTVMAGA